MNDFTTRPVIIGKKEVVTAGHYLADLFYMFKKYA